MENIIYGSHVSESVVDKSPFYDVSQKSREKGIQAIYC